MTTDQINEAFQTAIENNEIKTLKQLNKHDRANLKKQNPSIGKKLEILWMLGKIKFT